MKTYFLKFVLYLAIFFGYAYLTLGKFITAFYSRFVDFTGSILQSVGLSWTDYIIRVAGLVLISVLAYWLLLRDN